MMTLDKVLDKYHTEQFTDTSGANSFYGMIEVFDDSKGSGLTATRRILEVAAAVSLPSDNVIKESSTSQKYLAGSIAETDYRNGGEFSKKYPLIPVSSQFTARSIAEVLQATEGTGFYAHQFYTRRTRLDEDSDFYSSYDLYFSSGEEFTSGVIFTTGNKWFRSRENSRIDAAGFGAIDLIELDSPLISQSVVVKTLNPVTDVETTSSKTINTFVEPFVLDYFHQVLGFIEAGVGDQAISVLKTDITTLNRGDSIGANGLVISVRDNGSIWTALTRRNSA